MSGKLLAFSIAAVVMLGGTPLSGQYSYLSHTKFIKGYIINNSGDSITGYIGKPSKNAKVAVLYFRKNDDLNPTKLSPADISHFGFTRSREKYYSVSVPLQEQRTQYFVKLVLDGPYPVYYYEFLGNKHMLIGNPARKVYDLFYPPDYDIPPDQPASEDKFTHTLRMAFSDNPVLLAGIGTISSDRNSVLKYLTGYYRDKGISYKSSSIHILTIKLGFMGGLGISNLNWGDYRQAKGMVISPGAGVSLSLFDRGIGLGISAEDCFSYATFHSDFEKDQDGQTDFSETFLKTAMNESRIGLTWRPEMKGKLSPFLTAGGAFTALISPSYDNYSQVSYDNDKTVYSSQNKNDLFSSKYFGGFIRTGVTLSKADHLISFFAGYSYLKGPGSGKLTSAQVGIQYELKLK